MRRDVVHVARWLGVGLGLVLPLVTAVTAHAGTGREQEAFADEALERMQSSATSVRDRLARASKDAARTLCLTDKLSALETARRKAQDARGTLRRASLREDQDGIAQAAAAIHELDGRARQLRAEADRCVGEEDATVVQAAKAGDPIYLEQLDTPSEDAGIRAYRRPVEEDNRRAAPATPVVPLTAAAATPTPGPTTPFSPTPSPQGSPYALEASHEASMLAYSADLTLAVFQVDNGLTSVEALARELGGYLAQRGDAQVTVKVPRPRFEEAMIRIEKLGDVLHRNIAAEDVTDEYVDLELRLKNARGMRDRLAELLHGAAVKDAVEIEKELAKVTEVIEQIEGRLKVLRDKVGFSSITVSFQAHAAATVRSTAILPFPCLDTMGLQPLLDVPKVAR